MYKPRRLHGHDYPAPEGSHGQIYFKTECPLRSTSFPSISREWLILAKCQDIPCSALVNQDLNEKGEEGICVFLAK
jgi:hypothetical protein